VMADAQAIISWLQATGLRPFLATLDETEQTAFLTDYHKRLLAAYPAQADGQVLLAFPRLFMVAVKKPVSAVESWPQKQRNNGE